MHSFDDAPSSTPEDPSDNRPWYKLLNRYHWFVLIVAALGWLFDTMDQQLFALARTPAMRELLTKVVIEEGVEKKVLPDPALVAEYGGYATAIFLLGWATGGLFFGALGDRFGRAKVMLWTILLYSLCTGLSALSTNVWDFAFYRFITGLGVGGEFAVGVALVAEVMPSKARPFALGLLQALSAVGNISAAVINIGMGIAVTEHGTVGGTNMAPWRMMFVVGTLPALLAILIRRNLKEPEQWAKQAGQRKGNILSSFGELLSDARWRKNALIGLTLGFAGVVGLWGIGFFTFDLLSNVLRARFEAEGIPKEQIAPKIAFWTGMTSIFQNFGAFFGVYGFSYLAHYLGRRTSFAIAFLAAMCSTAYVFAFFSNFHEVFWLIPIMGFCQLSLFGGFAIYFPELFPTRLRSTGTSFCYNVGRFVAAAGPLTLGLLTRKVFTVENGYFILENGAKVSTGMRWAGVTMCSVFILGLLILPFAPETKGKPLPE
ncbi:MAG: MFS transporter [Planctomycetaceae bacterium]